MNDKYNLIDNDGYKYYTKINGLCYDNGYPHRFHKNNIYTIENIKYYIDKNNITAKLLSSEYINSKSLLDFECKCGNIFHKSWSKFQSGQIRCKDRKSVV